MSHKPQVTRPTLAPLRDKPVDFTKDTDEWQGKWHVTHVSAVNMRSSGEQIEALCSGGWEPFAVDDGTMWLRKRY